ncbi:hypothetical protein [Pontibacter vulgaris]|uniref:hypothetical protein n=1 Tax=Pontibacter vulgaris TaxID=2905679 RepID=UPI001FA73516|nr:hypothetical protein [Pontibacter vulgaris]
MKTATGIKTEDWNRIIRGLLDEGWVVSAKYDGFDAGIDYDFIILRDGKRTIEFGWDNWMEGEIKATEEILEEITQKFEIDFKYGKPSNLTLPLIRVTKINIAINKITSLINNKLGRLITKK